MHAQAAATGADEPENQKSHQNMKYLLLTLWMAVLPCPADLSITADDLFAQLTNQGNGNVLDLTKSPGEIEKTIGKDSIITGRFDMSQIDAIASDNDRSYIGIRRVRNSQTESESIAFSCAGVTLQDGYVFNRSQPGSTMGSTIITDNYEVLIGQDMITPAELATQLRSGNTAALTLMRTPQPGQLDIMVISVRDAATGEFSDYAVGLDISTEQDIVGLDLFMMDKHRFDAGDIYLGTGYGLTDAVAATHHILGGSLTPEPATATLSLAALTALAAKRRRK